MFLTYIETIKNGKIITDSNIKCDRCNRTNGISYITYKNTDLCFTCVEILNIIDNKPPVDILVRMEIDIYKKDYNIIPNDDKRNEIIRDHIKIKNITQFCIVDKFNDIFKVSINNKIYDLTEDEIILNYWNYLSYNDKVYFKSNNLTK